MANQDTRRVQEDAALSAHLPPASSQGGRGANYTYSSVDTRGIGDGEDGISRKGFGGPTGHEYAPFVDNDSTSYGDASAKGEGGGGAISLTSRHHAAIPISYFCVGFLGSFVANPLNIYIVQTLNAQPSQQNTLVVLMTVPWSFKLIYGFLSDVCPIRGLRRKPYLAFGYLLSSFCYLVLALTAEVTIQSLSGLLFLATMGQIMGDVMADTLVVERARGEAEESRGQMQATCYAIRFAGNVIGCLGGALLFNRGAWGWGLTFRQVCLIMSMMPVLVLGPAVVYLWEERSKETKGVKNQVRDIWDTIQLQAVWRPMAFVYIFNIFQVPHIPWQNYLQLSLHFQPYMLGFMAAAGSVMTCLGVTAYKNCFFHVSWRLIYGWSVVVTTIFSALQLVLIFGLNQRIGLPDFWFALGDDVITQYIQGIQFLPVCIMYLRMCPNGSEGATYAALTTFGNIALNCAGSLGTLFAKLWDVGNDTLRNEDVSGLWKLTVLTSLISPVPLVLLRLLPASAAEQEALRADTKRSMRGGAAFVSVLVGSLAWTLAEAVYVLSSDADETG
ncbi:conserved unknown protein [Ectocarpus siliculosus]|uniref:Folate/biopterin transporter n=1 Tax=Ectocarpus siliculosus TaxID=2880 RepID=D7FZP1_ECTSI|nr:conserved unknown protein [Ectocarpus siliculosus]|eukprot:CBJ32848.1 conserved unknown protein [Ectocarpus siliculosus]